LKFQPDALSVILFGNIIPSYLSHLFFAKFNYFKFDL